MEIEDYYKYYCKLEILSEELSVDEITKQLGISPHRSIPKENVGKYAKSTYHHWEVSSSIKQMNYLDINSSLDELRIMLKSNFEGLRLMKNDPLFKSCIRICIETDEEVSGLYILEPNLYLINLVNKVDLRFLPINKGK